MHSLGNADHAREGIFWLSVKEYAAQEHVHPDTVRRWARAGHLVIKRMGKRGWYKVRSENTDVRHTSS